MKLRVTATEAARTFSDLVNRVHYRGETFVVERGGWPVCEIVPARSSVFTGRDLAQLLSSLPKPDPEYLDVLEALLRSRPSAAESPWPH